MIKENEIVTKSYLSKVMKDFVTKKYMAQEFTKFRSSFGAELRAEMKEQKFEILREVRVMIFESLETIKVYFEETTNRHMGALREGFRDDILVYRDELKALQEKSSDHETRITTLERPV